MRASVVIPVKNDSGRLRLCLEALSRQSLSQDAYEVVVADNGSTDEPERALIGFPFARLVREEKPGASAARNRGVRESRSPCIAFTDADCLPERCWLESGLNAMSLGGEDELVAGRVDVFPQDPTRPTALELFDMIHAFDQRLFVERWHFGATANLFVSRAVFENLGGFDEAIPYYGEDVDFGQRARMRGHAIRYANDAVVRHPARRDWIAFYGKQRRIVGAAYGGGGRSPRRLLLDLWYDWPDARTVIDSFRKSSIGPLGSVKTAAATAWIRLVRTVFRLSLYGRQITGGEKR